MFTCVIIDDEMDARQTLRSFIGKYCAELEIAGEADGVKSGSRLINDMKPDIIFIDIMMSDGTGFDVLDVINQSGSRVIFTTAHEGFALRAIKYSAVDYLLKPIDPDELTDAVNKISNYSSKDKTDKIDILKQNLSSTYPTRLVIPDLKGISVIDIDNIIRCQSSNNYTVVYLVDKSEVVASRTLKDIEELLAPWPFFRVHNSHLVNLKHVKRFVRDGEYIVLSDGSQAEVSKRKKNDFIKLLNSL